MKILYSLPHPSDRLEGERAGHTVRANALIRHLEARGHSVVRVEAAAGSGLGRRSVSVYRGIVKRILPAPLAKMLRDIGRVRFGVAYGKRLTDIAAKEKPDVILETHIGFSLGGAIASRNTGIPLALDDVAPWWEELEYGVGLKHVARAIHRRAMSAASLVVAVNETLRGLLIEGGVDPEKVAVVRNGVRPEFLTAPLHNETLRETLGIPQNAVVIMFVGSFQGYHKVDLLTDAYRQLRPSDVPLHLLLVGGDAEAAGDIAKRPDVTATGWIPHDRIVDYLALGDIAVMPATNSYGDPMKVYEYLSMGKAVVAPNVPTLREVVRPDVDALLFDADDVPSLAATLQRLVDDSDLRDRLGAAGRETAPGHQWSKRAETLARNLERIARHA